LRAPLLAGVAAAVPHPRRPHALRRRAGGGEPGARRFRPGPRGWDNRSDMSTLPTLLPPLRIGPHTIDSPVVLAPMAGITNRAFRKLCREYGDQGLAAAATAAGAEEGAASGSGCLYVSEMVTSRALVERTPISMKLIEHDPEEQPRSVQLYGVDPATVGA